MLELYEIGKRSYYGYDPYNSAHYVSKAALQQKALLRNEREAHKALIDDLTRRQRNY